MIARDSYIKQIESFIDHKLIKIITGILAAAQLYRVANGSKLEQ
jgi:hypothetical protein